MTADALATLGDRTVDLATPVQEGNMGKGEQLFPWGARASTTMVVT